MPGVGRGGRRRLLAADPRIRRPTGMRPPELTAHPPNSTQTGLSGASSPALATLTGDVEDPDDRQRPSPAEPLPERFGRYPVLALLGRGGFGSVYLARDEELGRLVAIKVLHPGVFRNPGQVESFLAEARIAAGLRPPGDRPGLRRRALRRRGEVFVVFEYVEGREPVRGAPRPAGLPPRRSRG